MPPSSEPKPPESVVRTPVWVIALTALVCGCVGGVLGALTPAVVDWLADQGWIPFMKGPLRGLSRAIDSNQGDLLSIGLVVAGVVLGLWFTYKIDQDALLTRVRDDRVTLGRDDETRDLHARIVAAAYVDHKDLVLVGHDGDELFRRAIDLSPARYREAFQRHGYTWLDSDPYASAFQPWVEGDPRLPAGANTLLAARASARAGKDNGAIATLTRQLAETGVVVKDVKTRQHWRPTASPR